MEKLGLKKISNLKGALSSQLVTQFKRALRMIGDKSDSASNLQVFMKRLPDASFNCEAYILANRRMHEIENQKAMAIFLSRHERWKGAGGPC